MNARELLDAYAYEDTSTPENPMSRRYDAAYPMYEALRTVLDRHKPMRWYSECMEHREDTYPDFGEKHFYVGELGLLTCEEQRQPDVCQECTPDGADDNEIPWPCRTVQDITTALEAALTPSE